MLSSCKICKVANSKNIKDINTNLGVLAHYDKVQLQDKGYNSECFCFGVMPFLTKKIN